MGALSTVGYLAVYAALRHGLPAQGANLVALLTTAVANTAANRRITFGVTGRRHAGRHHLLGLAVFGLGLALTSGCLELLHAVDPEPATTTELVALAGANLVATLVRFLLLRHWLFHRPRSAAGRDARARPAERPGQPDRGAVGRLDTVDGLRSATAVENVPG